MRPFTILLLLVVLVTGATVGVLGRTWLDSQRSQGQATGEPTTPVTSAPSVGVAPAAPPPPAAAPASQDMVVEVSESELQSQVSTMLVGQSLGRTPLGETTIQSITVALRDRQVHVDGAARTGMLNAPFTAVGTVTPDPNGRARVQVNEASVGGVLLPDGARDALADSFQAQVDDLFARRSLKVRKIDIEDGKMRVVGTAGG